MRKLVSRLPILLLGVALGAILVAVLQTERNRASGQAPRWTVTVDQSAEAAPPEQPYPAQTRSARDLYPPPVPDQHSPAINQGQIPYTVPFRPGPYSSLAEPPSPAEPEVASDEGTQDLSAAVAEPPVDPTAAAILGLRQMLGDPLRGTALESDDSDEFASTFARVAEALSNQPVREGFASPEPWPSPAPVTLNDEQVRRLRQVARCIDDLSNDLEDAALFPHADQLRGHAQELREHARSH